MKQALVLFLLVFSVSVFADKNKDRRPKNSDASVSNDFDDLRNSRTLQQEQSAFESQVHGDNDRGQSDYTIDTGYTDNCRDSLSY